MPAYNADKWIEQSIVSVLHQTFTDFELIICDDFSSDSTKDIINKYISIDNRVKYITNKNPKGAAGARNTILDIARGEYITFLDSDDIWKESKLLNQYLFMKSNSVGFSFSDYEMFDETMSCKRIFARRKVTFTDLLYTCDIGCLTVMVRRDCLGVMRFPYIYKEDYALWLLILKSGVNAYNTGYNDAMYRKSSTSISSNKLKEIKRQYMVLKNIANVGLFQRAYYLAFYIVNAFRKHYI